MDISEKNFESLIEDTLLRKAPAQYNRGTTVVADVTVGYSAFVPGGYYKRTPEQYDRTLCLIPADVFAFIQATQPKEWEKYAQQHPTGAKDEFLYRLSNEIKNRGTLDALRNGVKANGCRFRLAYFRPSSGLNPEIERLYLANIFSVVRQLRYSQHNDNLLDLVIFLNGLPIFTAELKNPLAGQNVQNAINQYRHTRDPREPLFLFGRCLAHFAVDPELVYMTTRLQGPATEFLPFNKGRGTGAGNPPSMDGFATAYLWENVWSRDSILDLIQNFIQLIELEDDEGRKTGEKKLIFPRYHQLDAVRRLVSDAKANGSGQRYLIQHSAGSGKSNSIAWVAHQLVNLHDSSDRRVFDSIIVITDRRVLDRQLQRTVRQFQQTRGVVENIDTTSKQLKQALEEGKNIIVTTLQKFPVIVNEVKELPGQRFAVIIDEAHSSQTGEATKSLKAVLSVASLEEAEKEESVEEEDLEDKIAEEARTRGRLPNVSYFAFTATPKPKTLELFGVKLPDGKFGAFSLYSMRQAIEEKFILDVLDHYTTYKSYFSLLKKISDDPRYDRKKANFLLTSFVDLHEHTIRKKVEIIIEHFAEYVMPRIDGKAKAMIVTRSRLHAVRYKLAVDQYLKERGYTFKTLVAFSGSVKDPFDGQSYTESGMNSQTVGRQVPETQTAKTFEGEEYKILIVAYKFQTGFDQPLLHTMYVDQKLAGVKAVQTLSRLNRIHPGKQETIVLDFANNPAEIQDAFQPYYEKTLLKEATDPNLLYDLQTRIESFHFHTSAEVDAFARAYFDEKATQDKLFSILRPVVDRFLDATKEEKVDFRSAVTDFVRLYAFLSQIITFVDVELEKFYAFARLLSRRLPIDPERLPVEIQQNIDMDSYRIQKTTNGRIKLARGPGELEPMGPKGPVIVPPEDMEPLSRIIKDLNERFGTNFSEDDKVFIQQFEAKLAGDTALDATVLINPKENVKLTFDQVANDRLQEMMESNFKFYKQVTDDAEFRKYLFNWLFDRFYASRSSGSAGAA